jgi:hAT family C-terminal dimerisation region
MKIILSQTHELDKYMRSPPENVKDPLKWWTQHAAMYPVLSRMALDYLSILGKFSDHF